MTCPVQDLYHHPLESQQEHPKDQPDLLRQCNFYKKSLNQLQHERTV